MTIAQFFRVNGGTNQLRGVTPDINLPTMTDAKEYGEFQLRQCPALDAGKGG